MAHLIPQVSLSNATIAKHGNRMFISAGGSLFEYIINPYYRHTLGSYSIRDIFLEDSLSIISTYSGIFINDSIRAKKPDFSNGALCKIGNRYFLCNDVLFEFTKPANFTQIKGVESIPLGLIRKMVLLNGQIYTQNTRTINLYDSLKGIKTLHDGFEFFDLENFNGTLISCTATGEVFSYNNGTPTLLFDINTRIRDIYPFRDVLFFASDLGVYSIKNGDPATLIQLLPLPHAVNVKMDRANNNWIATENGLYVLPDKYSEAIPFIPNVEFNRGALTIHNDTLYAGSIEGLFIIDTYMALKSFIPQYLNKKVISDTKSFRIQLSIIIALLLIGIAVSVYYFRYRKITIPQTQKEKTVITLEQIAVDINANNITTVEGLAAFYETNPVQLNRLFKNYDTTPGKYLKKVKLTLAKELLKKGASMEDVVSQTGYTAHYIQQHLIK
jgi:AraC-like DNA-binding protein